MSRYSPTERIGISAVENIVLKELGWIFREQPIIDMGIDAHIESVIDGNPTGKLLGVQIKTGISHFYEKDESLTYYGTSVHQEYWLNHALPVIIVAHIPERDITVWAHVNKENVELTDKAWKIEIPKNQIINKSSKEAFEAVLAGTKEEVKRRNLVFHLGSMRHIKEGGKLVVYKEEWHNKSLGRGVFQLIKVNKDKTEEVIETGNRWYTGYSTKELIEKIYPWSKVSVDEEYYKENFCRSFYHVYTDRYKEMHEVYPYAVSMGEISHYRLLVNLNSLGESFLEVMAYLENKT